MKSKIRKHIEALEEQIFKGYHLRIFKGYIAINKTGAEKIIDEIYASLPEDIQQARQYLRTYSNSSDTNTTKNSKIYEILKNLENLLKKNVFLNYSIVNKEKLDRINEKLQESIQEEILKAETYE